MCDQTIIGICFTRPPSDAAGIFGFAEFLAALALLVLVFNSTDPLYKFRISVAPIPLIAMTFAATAFIGLGALVNDLWFAQKWLAPALGVTKAEIQAMLGGSFLVVLLVWTWFAFIDPSKFTRFTAKQYARSIYWAIVRGSDKELSVIAAELARSGSALVKFAGERRFRPTKLNLFLARRYGRKGYGWARPLIEVIVPNFRKRVENSKPTARDYARDILLIIANRKLCRHIVENSPVTVLTIFDSAKRFGIVDIPINQFITNINTASIEYADSILYHEDGVYSGGLGQIQPYGNTVYGNFELVERIRGLDIDYRIISKMSPDQYEIYCHIVSIAFRSWITTGASSGTSFCMNAAFRNLESALWDVAKLKGLESYGDHPGYEKMWATTKLVNDLIECLEKSENLSLPSVRLPEKSYSKEAIELLADFVYCLIERAAAVSEPDWTAWDVQHNGVWSAIFSIRKMSKVREYILLRVERIAFKDISDMNRFVNYKGARIIGYFVNIYGFSDRRLGDRAYGGPLRRYVMWWMRKNYSDLAIRYPDVASACLSGSITFDKGGNRLVQSFQKSMDGKRPQRFLQLDQPQEPEVGRAEGGGQKRPKPNPQRRRTPAASKK